MLATVRELRPGGVGVARPPEATFQVLGPISVRLGDRSVRLRGARHREVLARLLVARGQVVPVDRLIDDLWPEQPPQQALAAVQAFVSQLRPRSSSHTKPLVGSYCPSCIRWRSPAPDA